MKTQKELMRERLSPCNCGSDNLLIQYDWLSNNMFVTCGDCGRFVDERTQLKTIQVWNSDVKQCVYDKAITCVNDEPCKYCEVYAEWFEKHNNL